MKRFLQDLGAIAILLAFGVAVIALPYGHRLLRGIARAARELG